VSINTSASEAEVTADAIQEYVAKAERERIIATIKGRRDFHVSFANHSLDAGVEPSDSIYTAIAELNAIIRELEQ